ncbi:putative ABC transporter ATP-binding protein YknY [Usitatibacter palustris]|uniref:Putative ABC transporter ATP-binding protein YknY n=2 Tax=Usitatibacter palustris TaxID=2732487 RepID=A0A6M4H7V6_9PROT|nr:putative ABC transporter ATP-binding protein YknY [Usitatibacter palustris]
MVEIDAVSRTYAMPGGQSWPALRGLTLSVPAGESVAVLGKSGSGKSTLLNLIAGLDRPTSGTVRVAGEDLTRLSESAIAPWRGRHVGVVFQFFQLLPTLTVVENIVLAMELVATIAPRDREPRALALLERVGLADQARKLPSMLSGGQQQRAAIARALANDPPILLADEPTGNLDSETAADLGRLFDELVAQGKTLIIVTHDPNLAQAAHRIVSLRDGLIASDRAAA